MNKHWFATRLLPIFLVLVLVFGGIVYAVPSFRTKFTGFLKSFGLKADTGAIIASSIPTSTPTSSLISSGSSDCGSGSGGNHFYAEYIGGKESYYSRTIARDFSSGAVVEEYGNPPSEASDPAAQLFTNSDFTKIKFDSEVEAVSFLDASLCQYLYRGDKVELSAGGNLISVDVSASPNSNPDEVDQSIIQKTIIHGAEVPIYEEISYPIYQRSYDLPGDDNPQIGTITYQALTQLAREVITKVTIPSPVPGTYALRGTWSEGLSTLNRAGTISAKINITTLNYKVYQPNAENPNDRSIDSEITTETTVNSGSDQTFYVKRTMTSDFGGRDGIISKDIGEASFHNGDFNTDAHNDRSFGDITVSLESIPNETPPTEVTLLDVNNHNQPVLINLNHSGTLITTNQHAAFKIKSGSGKFKLSFSDPANPRVPFGEGSMVVIANSLDVKFLNPLNRETDSLNPSGNISSLEWPEGLDGVSDVANLQHTINSLNPNTPLKANWFVGAGREFGVNPAFLIAIARKETSLATNSIDYTHADPVTGGAYNIGNILNDNGNGYKNYTSYENGIKGLAQYLSDGYLRYAADPKTTVKEIAYIYCPPVPDISGNTCDTTQWITDVNSTMKKIFAKTPELSKEYLIKIKFSGLEIANRPIKVTQIDGSGKLHITGEQNAEFPGNEYNLLTNEYGIALIRVGFKKDGLVKLKFDYQVNENSQISKEVSITVKPPKYKVSYQLKEKNNSGQWIKSIENKLYNNGKYKLTSMLSVDISPEDYEDSLVNNKTINISQEGEARITSNGSEQNSYSIATDLAGDAELEMQGKKVAPELTLKMLPVNIVSSNQPEKTVNLEVAGATLEIESCPIALNESSNPIAQHNNSKLLSPVLAQSSEVCTSILNEGFNPDLIYGPAVTTNNAANDNVDTNTLIHDVNNRINSGTMNWQYFSNYHEIIGQILAKSQIKIIINNTKYLTYSPSNEQNPLFQQSLSNRILKTQIQRDLLGKFNGYVPGLTQEILNTITDQYLSQEMKKALQTVLMAGAVLEKLSSGEQITIPLNLTMSRSYNKNGLRWDVMINGVTSYNRNSGINTQFNISMAAGLEFQITNGVKLVVSGYSTGSVSNICAQLNITAVQNCSLRVTYSTDGTMRYEFNAQFPVSFNGNENASPTANSLISNDDSIDVIYDGPDGLMTLGHYQGIGDFLNEMLGIKRRQVNSSPTPTPTISPSQSHEDSFGPQQPMDTSNNQSAQQSSDSFTINPRVDNSKAEPSNRTPIANPDINFVGWQDQNSSIPAVTSVTERLLLDPIVFITAKDSNDIIAVNNNDIVRNGVNNLVLDVNFYQSDKPQDTASLVKDKKIALQDKFNHGFCDSNLTKCDLFTDSQKIYPKVPILEKPIEGLAAGDKKAYTDKYTDYVKDFNQVYTREQKFLNDQFAANPLLTQERVASREDYIEGKIKENGVEAKKNLDNLFNTKNKFQSVKTLFRKAFSLAKSRALAADYDFDFVVRNTSDNVQDKFESGDEIKIQVNNLKNSEYYEVYLDNQFLARAQKISNDFSFTVIIPQNTKTGEHKIVLIGSSAGEQLEKNLQVENTNNQFSTKYLLILVIIILLLAVSAGLLIKTHKKNQRRSVEN